MPRSNDALREVERAWTQAETRDVTDTLGTLATPDLRLVGPSALHPHKAARSLLIGRRRLRASVGPARLEKTTLGPAASVTTGLAMSSAAREGLVGKPQRPY